MKNGSYFACILVIVFAIGALAPATATAAPPRCSCYYCEQNPEDWCSYLGATNRCSLFATLYCGGGGALTIDDGIQLAVPQPMTAECEGTTASEDVLTHDEDAYRQIDDSINLRVEGVGEPAGNTASEDAVG